LIKEATKATGEMPSERQAALIKSNNKILHMPCTCSQSLCP